jgi:hypothetical protein
MSRLIDEGLAEVNERGHYRCKRDDAADAAASAADSPVKPAAVDGVVDENYFPALTQAPPRPERWIAPEIARILKNSPKGSARKGGHHRN